MAAISPLQQTLKSLCSRTSWCYAVFWKLKRRSRMMLTWEDGYYDSSSSSAVASISHGGIGCSETGGNPLDQGGSGDMEGQIGLTVARMSYFVYSMGEGVIGRVAFTGKHQLVYHDRATPVLEGAVGSKPNNRCVSEKNPDGWENQFAAGIKTIAVIAVPQGVVQLGSTKVMQEDLKWIDHIKSVFGALQTTSSATRLDLISEGQGGRRTYNTVPPLTSGSNMPTQARTPVAMQQGQPSLRNNEDCVCPQGFGGQASAIGVSNTQANTIGVSNIEALQSMGGHTYAGGTIKQEIQNQQPSKMMVEPEVTKYASAQSRALALQVASTNVPRFDVPSKPNTMITSCDELSSRPLGDVRPELLTDLTWVGLMKGGMLHSVGNTRVALAASSKGEAQLNASGMGSWNIAEIHRSSERDSDFHSLSSQSDVNTLDELERFLASFPKEENGNWDCSFAIGDELSHALGSAFWKGELPMSCGSEKSVHLREAGQVSMSHGEPTTLRVSKLACDNAYRSLLSISSLNGDREPLLDAVVSNVSNSLRSVSDVGFSEKTPLSNKTCGMPVLSMSEPASNSSNMVQAIPNDGALYGGNSAYGFKAFPNHCASTGDAHTNVTSYSWTDDGHSWRSDDTRNSLSKRSDDLSRTSKKRSRSGESTRPRPKDRQQIQDRVRELRDIVPNGSKCSIDALLEKTIKHMLFLHSVSLKVDQLKNIGELEDDTDIGASWAVDLGSQDRRYPIVVKDLSQPRQMLVEMMCEESDLFLEMADIIRSLGLTILRGVMESHKNKFWAKFVVEANRDIERVDVLVSLIQRLHLDNYSSSSSMTMTSQSAASLRP